MFPLSAALFEAEPLWEGGPAGSDEGGPGEGDNPGADDAAAATAAAEEVWPNGVETAGKEWGAVHGPSGLWWKPFCVLAKPGGSVLDPLSLPPGHRTALPKVWETAPRGQPRKAHKPDKAARKDAPREPPKSPTQTHSAGKAPRWAPGVSQTRRPKTRGARSDAAKKPEPFADSCRHRCKAQATPT